MAIEKKIQIKNSAGEHLFPKTKAELVVTSTGTNLGTVEAGAQVNKIEQIKVNGRVIAPVTKVVNIAIPEAAEYSIKKETQAEEGFAATYHLTKNGATVGQSINIPKDMVVQSGSVKTVETPNMPMEGYQVGQKYIDLLLANGVDQHIYILVNELVDVYTAGKGVKLEGRAFSVDEAVVATKTFAETTFAKKATDLAGYGITNAYTKGEVDTKLTAKAEASAVTALNNTVEGLKTSKADATTVTALTKTVEGKANKATTLAGYGITDALTFEEIA